MGSISAWSLQWVEYSTCSRGFSLETRSAPFCGRTLARELISKLGKNILTVVCLPVVSSHPVFSNTQRFQELDFICHQNGVHCALVK